MHHVRWSQERGHARHGWLDSHHTFSFADYYDPNYMGFGALRVINEDRVAPSAGFPTHGHRDMEIISYVLSGRLRHEDSMGNGSVIVPGEIQYMSAGTGVRHSEYNDAGDEPVHFFQIWIVPNRRGTEPSYAQLQIDEGTRSNTWSTLVAPESAPGVISIKQDVRLLSSKLSDGHELSYVLKEGRGAWLQVARGKVDVVSQATSLGAGDALALVDEPLEIRATNDAELLLFEVVVPAG